MINLLSLADSLVDERIGILRGLHEQCMAPGAPDMFHFTAQTCATSTLNPTHNQGSIWGSGVSHDRTLAMAKAIGEAIERYCAAIYHSHDFTLSSYESAPFTCAQPDQFALFSPSQYEEKGFPFVPFNRKSLLRWSPALDLVTGKHLFVPAQMVFLPYVPDREMGEQLICPQISTGLACHTDSTLAAISGTCEVIERDAFAITWQARVPQQKVRLNTLPTILRNLIKRIERPGSRIDLFYLRMDHGIPVILSTMTSEIPDAPALVVGASCHLDPAKAVQKSLEELAQIAAVGQSTKTTHPKFLPGDRWKNVVDPKSHAALYYDHAHVTFAEFLLNSPKHISFNQIENLSTNNPLQDLERLIQTLHVKNYHVLVADVTSDDVRMFGLWVLRIIIPGFHPLYMGHRFRALGGARLWKLPQTLGHSGITPKAGDNPFPHPFP